MARITRQGLPAATDRAGMSRVTTLPAPMTLPSPMCTPGITTQLPPIHTLSPMVTPTPYSYMVARASGWRGWPAV